MKPSCGLSTEVLAAVGVLAGRQKTGEWITAQGEKFFCAEGYEDSTKGLQVGSGARFMSYSWPNASRGKCPILAQGPLLNCCCNNNPCCWGLSLEAGLEPDGEKNIQQGTLIFPMLVPSHQHSWNVTCETSVMRSFIWELLWDLHSQMIWCQS